MRNYCELANLAIQSGQEVIADLPEEASAISNKLQRAKRSTATNAEQEEIWTLPRLQAHIHALYGDKDAARGIDGTFMWFMQEVGELASALRGEPRHGVAEEFADVLAWLVTLANVAEVDLNSALARKYGATCPGCGEVPCGCSLAEKP